MKDFARFFSSSQTSLAKPATRTNWANTRSKAESCCRSCEKLRPRGFTRLVEIADSRLVNQKVRASVEGQLDAVAVIPVDQAGQLFTILQHYYHWCFALHL